MITRAFVWLFFVCQPVCGCTCLPASSWLLSSATLSPSLQAVLLSPSRPLHRHRSFKHAVLLFLLLELKTAEEQTGLLLALCLGQLTDFSVPFLYSSMVPLVHATVNLLVGNNAELPNVPTCGKPSEKEIKRKLNLRWPACSSVMAT